MLAPLQLLTILITTWITHRGVSGSRNLIIHWHPQSHSFETGVGVGCRRQSCSLMQQLQKAVYSHLFVWNVVVLEHGGCFCLQNWLSFVCGAAPPPGRSKPRSDLDLQHVSTPGVWAATHFLAAIPAVLRACPPLDPLPLNPLAPPGPPTKNDLGYRWVLLDSAFLQ